MRAIFLRKPLIFRNTNFKKSELINKGRKRKTETQFFISTCVKQITKENSGEAINAKENKLAEENV